MSRVMGYLWYRSAIWFPTKVSFISIEMEAR